MKIDEMTDEELVELITEILDSPRAFKLLDRIPLHEREPKTPFAQALQKESPKEK